VPDLQKAFLGRGWAFAVGLDPRTGAVAQAAYEDDVRQSILIIIQTAPGERQMRPDFGCGIHKMVFAAIDTATILAVKASVLDALNKYEARIEIQSVDVDASLAFDGQLLISLDYRVRATNQSGNLVYPFYFKEGGPT
jgi:phage baseplate assembly protein W